MNLNRRSMLQGLTAGFGAALTGGLMPHQVFGTSGQPSSMKRIIFFLQNQGFEPGTCIPSGMNNSGSLANENYLNPLKPLNLSRNAYISSMGYMESTPVRPIVLSLAHWADTAEAMEFHRVARPLIMN